MPPGAADRIVVFLPNWVGDVVMASPVLRAMREHFRAAYITYVGRRIPLATADGCDWADDLILDIRDSPTRGIAFLRLVSRIRRRGYDLALLLPNSFRTAAAARLGGVKRIAGYDRDGRGWLLTDKIPPPRNGTGNLMPIPALEYYRRLAHLLQVPCDSRTMSLGVRPADDRAAEALLREVGIAVGEQSRPVVLLNPGAAFGASKMWSPQRYGAVADALIERRRAQIIINAAPVEKPVAGKVERAMRHEPALSFAERDNTIGLLKGLMRRCRLLITNDTGARHVAAAFGIDVVTLFGSTDPEWTRIDYPRERIVRVDVGCSPCQRKMCNQPPGPLYHQCMNAITPEMVLGAVEELLDNRVEEGGG